MEEQFFYVVNMESRTYPFGLRYSVKLHEAANPLALVRDMGAGFASHDDQRNSLTVRDISEAGEIKSSYVPETETYDI